MPFTPAHAAAVLPLMRWLGAASVPSALVIGSMAPDFVFFHADLGRRHETHSLRGLFSYCLPVGILVYLLFHAVLARPLVALAPPRVESRVRPLIGQPLPLSWKHWLAVAFCLLLGAATHLVWDGFTHENDFGVAAFPTLRTELTAVGGYPVYVYKLLQHGSTLFGLGIVSIWCLRALRRLPSQSGGDSGAMSRMQRLGIVCAVGALSIASAILAGARALMAGPPPSVAPLQLFAGRAVVAGITAAAVAVSAYAALWWIARWSRNRRR